MFLLMHFYKDVAISPSDLNKDLQRIIKVKLLEQIVGTCNSKYGYFIKIIDVDKIHNGLIMDGTGDIVFKIRYQVVFMRPFVNEVCEGIIEDVFDVGGFHVRVGPMLVYISHDNVHPLYKLDKANRCYINQNDNTELKKGTKVRFRYTDVSQFKNGFAPMGTIKDNYLGYLSDN